MKWRIEEVEELESGYGCKRILFSVSGSVSFFPCEPQRKGENQSCVGMSSFDSGLCVQKTKPLWAETTRASRRMG